MYAYDNTIETAITLQWNDIYPEKSVNTVIYPERLSNFEDYEINDHFDANQNLIFDEIPDSLFQTAQDLLKDTKNWRTFTKLDYLLPEPFLLPGSLTLLHTNDKLGKLFLINMFIKLILQYYNAGIVFIDCTNIFPAYELINSTMDMNNFLDPQLPIRAVQLSRAFNYHQATEVLTERLETLIRDGFSFTRDSLDSESEMVHVKPKFVIVAGLPDIFLNHESAQYLGYDKRPEWWSIFELQQSIGVLRSLSIKYNLISIITASSASSTKPLGGTFLTHSTATLIRIFSEGNGLYGELAKHPSAPSKKILLQLIKASNKRISSRLLKKYL